MKSEECAEDNDKFSIFAQEYIDCMDDMDGRSPGKQNCIILHLFADKFLEIQRRGLT